MFEFEDVEQKETSNYVEEKYGPDKERLNSEIEEVRKEVMDLINEYENTNDADDTDTDVLKSVLENGLSMIVGDRELKFTLTGAEKSPTDDIREEIKKTYQDRLYKLKDVINDKLYSLSENFESIKEKLEDELEKTKDENSKFVMPDITVEHAKEGLSVVRGADTEELVWLYRGLYRVETIDGKSIDPEVSESTVTPAIMEIITNGNRVTSVKIRRWDNMKPFVHYHSIGSEADSDCWGDWEFQIQWETPDDIIELAEHGFAILTDVNSSSPGDRSPSFLPSIDDLFNSIVDEVSDEERQNMSSFTNRLVGRNEREYIWTA